MPTTPSRRSRRFLAATAMPSTASPPGPASDDVDGTPAAAGAGSSNFVLLYIIVAVLAGVIIYMVFRYGRAVLSEWWIQAARGGGHGAWRPAAAQIGLSMDDIAALPTFTYRARAALSALPSPRRGGCGGVGGNGRAAAAECAVCLQELEDGDVVRVLPPCRHFFHGGCIDVWLCAHSSCPVCRAHPEPELARLREAAVSPPLPQLRRCGASPERSPASKVLADILARSPLRSGCSTSGCGSKEAIMSKSPSPGPATRGYITSRSPSPSPSPAPPTPRRVNDELWSKSPPPRLLPESIVVRSKSPSPIRFGRRSPAVRCVVELDGAGMEVITSASPNPATATVDGGGSLSESPSTAMRYVGTEERVRDSNDFRLSELRLERH